MSRYYGYEYGDTLAKRVKIDDEFNKKILSIADYIIENNASYSQVAKEFGCCKSTIGEYMKERLPLISTDKSEEVNRVISGNTSSREISKEMKELILFEYELYKRGYKIEEVAYLVNNTYASTQRDLSNRLKKISEDKNNELSNMKNSNLSHKGMTSEMNERISLEYDLLMRGYSLNQIAYLTGGNYSTVQRDLSKNIQEISVEKYKKAKEKLKEKSKFKKVSKN